MISTFSEYSVMPEISCVKIAEDIPVASGVLGGPRCAHGLGSAVNLAGLRPGDVAIVMGVGGVGANAGRVAAWCRRRTSSPWTQWR
jgi:Zn-dependent alcohol dehydrogenase